jgi:hypothetical protein
LKILNELSVLDSTAAEWNSATVIQIYVRRKKKDKKLQIDKLIKFALQNLLKNTK